jgi:biopolymer transport protein ExbD
VRHARSRETRFASPVRVELLPLLDVVFLLLAVFLLTVVRMVRSYAVPVDLPSLATGSEQDTAAVLVLGIDAQGRIYLGGEALPEERWTEELRRRLAADPELQVLLQADREARHGAVAELLDAVRAAGVGRVLLLAEPREPAPQDAPAPQETPR